MYPNRCFGQCHTSKMPKQSPAVISVDGRLSAKDAHVSPAVIDVNGGTAAAPAPGEKIAEHAPARDNESSEDKHGQADEHRREGEQGQGHDNDQHGRGQGEFNHPARLPFDLRKPRAKRAMLPDIHSPHATIVARQHLTNK